MHTAGAEEVDFFKILFLNSIQSRDWGQDLQTLHAYCLLRVDWLQCEYIA